MRRIVRQDRVSSLGAGPPAFLFDDRGQDACAGILYWLKVGPACRQACQGCAGSQSLAK